MESSTIINNEDNKDKEKSNENNIDNEKYINYSYLSNI